MLPSYQHYVRAQAAFNPSLCGLVKFFERDRQQLSHASQCFCIEYLKINNQKRYLTGHNVQDLASKTFLSTRGVGPDGPDVAGRVYLVEDIDSLAIEFLGSVLDVNPLFFATYIDTSFSNLEKSPPPPSVAMVPSRFSESSVLHLHYQRVLDLGHLSHAPGEKLEIDANVHRSVKRTPVIGGVNIALARSCCSILRKLLDDETWLCLILVDSTTADIVRHGSSGLDVDRLAQVPLQGGFEDVLDPVPYSAFQVSPNQTENTERKPGSFARSLLRYLSTSNPPSFTAAFPTTLTLSYYPIKVINSEWVLYSLLLSRYVKHYEYALSDLNLQLHSEDLKALQPWRRRSRQSLHKLRLMHRFIVRYRCKEMDREPWDDIVDDIEYLSAQIGQWSTFFDSMASIATSMLQLTDTRRSLVESTHIRQLTYLALTFIPLSFVASLFSMSEEVNPWGGQFWVYWAVAFPLLVLVIILSFLPFRLVARKASKR